MAHESFWGKRLIETLTLRKEDVPAELRSSIPRLFLEALHNGQRQSLAYLFLSSSLLKVTNPSDRVYGLLALADDDNLDSISIDYNLPTPQVYMQVMKHWLHTRRSLGFLCFSGRSGAQPMPGLPTWVPAPDKRSLIAEGCMDSMASHNGDIAAHIDPEMGTLSVRGVRCGAIGKILEEEEVCDESVRDQAREIWTFLESSDSLESPQAVEHISFLLSIRPTIRDDLPAPQSESLLEVLNEVFEFLRRFTLSKVTMDQWICGSVLKELEHKPFFIWFLRCVYHKVLVVLKNGPSAVVSVAEVQRPPQIGDEVWILEGCPRVMILRAVEAREPRQYQVIGYAAISGMPGTADQLLVNNDQTPRTNTPGSLGYPILDFEQVSASDSPSVYDTSPAEVEDESSTKIQLV
ncbi:hypothetical protein GQ53DRAFT_745302 [Thozetella sp. PMI_491]|nr:hypothetical protein GQ53DRAFT_745302 [Thozetella sp. PMI_491]